MQVPTIHSVTPIDNSDAEGVIVLNSSSEILNLVGDTLSACQIFPASGYSQALEILERHQVGLIVSGVEGNNDSHEFFSLLKSEYPQVVIIVIAQSGDAGSMANLIKDARIYRYMFQPLKVGLLEQYLKSGLRQFQYYKSTTKSAVTQSASVDTTSAFIPVEAKTNGLKRFFSKF